MQVHGANGYSDEYPVGRFYRNCKGAVIYEGTREIHKIMQADYVLGFRQDKPTRCELPPYQETGADRTQEAPMPRSGRVGRGTRSERRSRPPRPHPDSVHGDCMNSDLSLDFLRVVEQAAIACAHTMGQGDRHKSDQAAVEAMRKCSTRCRSTARS